MNKWAIAWVEAVTEGLPGLTRLRVQGQSMTPTLRHGDEVLIEPVTVDALRPGDWVMVRGPQGGILHRYLGRRNGQILTKGDGRLALDPPWSPEVVLGRVVEAFREGRCFYRQTPGRMRWERLLTLGHHVVGKVWGMVRRLKAVLLALILCAWIVPAVWAAVTVSDFEVESAGDALRLFWQTASEVRNLGFYVWRSETATTGYVKIPIASPAEQFIPSEDYGVGAFYEFMDYEVTPGVRYYYKLQDVPEGGGSGQFFGPVSGGIDLPADTATPTPTPTATPTPTPTATPTATPHPDVDFWATKTDLNAGECSTVQWLARNVRAVFFDGQGVTGEGGKTFCPCKTETHTLYVTFLDGTADEFTLTLTVTGECGGSGSVIPTPSPPSPTQTPSGVSNAVPTATPQRATVTSTPTAAPRSSAPSPSPSPTPTPTVPPDSTAVAPVHTPTPESGPTGGAVPPRVFVEGEQARTKVPTGSLLLVVGGILGLGLIGVGVWLWRRQP